MAGSRIGSITGCTTGGTALRKRRLASPSRFAATSIVAVACGLSCQTPTEIVLVVDTDLTVPGDIDRIEIAAAGAAGMAPPISIDFGPGVARGFPLTLGLVPAGALAPVTVTVIGRLQGAEVVKQSIRTAFVSGEQRILRILLLESCLPVTCPGEQTCVAGACGPIDRTGTSLPPWTGTLPPRPDPPTTTPIAGRTVWASGWHSSAIEGTTLYSWGQNADGQLGTGNTQNAHARRPVMNVQDPASVGLGHLHSCVCDRAGQAFCWGRNMEGQLGTGNTTTSPVPIAVPGLTDCVQITGGGNHGCALRTGGVVSCWGSNSSGQCGQPGTGTIPTPMQVPGLTDVVQVQGGERYTCVRRADGTVSCWGDNTNGQLGDGTNTARSTPAPVMGLSDIVEVATGRFFACARHSSGQVSCWGANPGVSDLPVVVAGITDAVQMAAGQQHACVIRKTGVLSCWGGNSLGQLGNGTTTMSAVPVDVLDIAQVSSVAAGSVHTCARHAGGLACWGENLVNQLGDGSTTNRSRPVSVAGFL